MSRADRSTEPYRVLLATKLPREKDRRVKLTEKDKQEIRDRRKGGETIRSIARAFEDKCSRRTVQYVLRPELYDKLREQFKERRKDGRYKPSKEEWAATQREHRRYKVRALKGSNPA